MELCDENQEVEKILTYPETRDINYFESEGRLKEFEKNVRLFSFPYKKTLLAHNNQNKSNVNTSLVQFYTFVLTDANRIRQYGFCRSSNGGKHVLCMISYLPWHTIFMSLLNKISAIINERKVK